MPQIVFWSPIHGQTGVTSNIMTTAFLLALEANLKILLTHTQLTRSIMEKSIIKDFDSINGVEAWSDSGVDGLERLASVNRLNSESVKNYTKAIFKNSRLDILIGSKKPNEEVFEKSYRSSIQPILTCAAEYYDIVFVDLHSGFRSEISKELLRGSDLIVINLNQNIHLIKQYLRDREIQDLIGERAVLICLGRYDPHSKYSIYNLKKKYKLELPMFAIPYYIGLTDGMNSGEVSEFFVKNYQADKGHESYYFIRESRLLALEILKRAGELVAKKG